MCAVSMITGHYQGIYQNPQDFPNSRYHEYSELVRKARLYDEMTRQPYCPDPAKDAWHQALEKFMKEKYGLEPK
jgi:hypothetical protein